MNKVENFFENNFLGQVIFIAGSLLVFYVMIVLVSLIQG